MASSTDISNITQQWADSLHKWHLEFFCIPSIIVTLTILLTNPILLTCILLSRALRKETRYLLVVNTLTADMLFVILNLVTVLFNTARAQIPWLVCELLTAVIVTAYCCAILTVTLMVVDTYAAVRWPLRYHDLLPPARIYRILVIVWLVAACFPFSLVIVLQVKGDRPDESVYMCLVLISLGFIQIKNMDWIHMYFIVAALVCAALIFYCYIRLYMVTRTQGIWQSRFSRARVTLLAHGVLLLLYFAPGFVFSLELYIFHKENISQDVRIWISTVNMSVFMLIPRAFAPFLYGLRYREIYDTLIELFLKNRRLNQITVS
ncbi:probable G-protein coupled receptor 148 [Sphaeramia orbicularis]|uniref:probable G-protein coupled receptor 148 n=1 Tax=Sphaeramia orbicularis TaxID=375764 RepID=UPI00117D836A|nr:probable G-protein coupled receptor 148 [Sphaeramia orbicularis]